MPTHHNLVQFLPILPPSPHVPLAPLSSLAFFNQLSPPLASHSSCNGNCRHQQAMHLHSQPNSNMTWHHNYQLLCSLSSPNSTMTGHDNVTVDGNQCKQGIIKVCQQISWRITQLTTNQYLAQHTAALNHHHLNSIAPTTSPLCPPLGPSLQWHCHVVAPRLLSLHCCIAVSFYTFPSSH